MRLVMAAASAAGLEIVKRFPAPAHPRRGSGRSGRWPDLQGAEPAAILQEARILIGEPHVPPGPQLAVPPALDAGEVDEAAPRYDHRVTARGRPPWLSPARCLLSLATTIS